MFFLISFSKKKSKPKIKPKIKNGAVVTLNVGKT